MQWKPSSHIVLKSLHEFIERGEGEGFDCHTNTHVLKSTAPARPLPMASSHYVSCQLHVSVQTPVRSLKFKLFKTKLISICMAIHPAKSLLIIFLSLNYTVEQVIDYKPRVHLQFNPTNLTRRLSPESIHFSSFPTVAISFKVTVISCLELPLNLSICFYLY